MSKPRPNEVSDKDVIAMLMRYNCPLPFHAVRTRFLGSIASPVFSVSPQTVVQSLWDGAQPVFETPEAADEFFKVLLSGLWNRLTLHQKSRDPFRVVWVSAEPTRASMVCLAVVRQQELSGFLEGLFAGNESIDLPEIAYRGVDVLFNLRDMFGSAETLLDDSSKPAALEDLKELQKNFQHMSLIAETEINRIVHDCQRSRSRPSNFMASDNRTLH
jgi:hypothetical protein